MLGTIGVAEPVWGKFEPFVLDAFVGAEPVLGNFDDIVAHVVLTVIDGILEIRRASETHLERSVPSTRVLLKAGVWKDIFLLLCFRNRIHRVSCPLKKVQE